MERFISSTHYNPKTEVRPLGQSYTAASGCGGWTQPSALSPQSVCLSWCCQGPAPHSRDPSTTYFSQGLPHVYARSDCGSEVQTRKKGWRCGLSKHRGSGSAVVVTKEPPPPQSVHRRLEGGGLGTIAMPREPQWVPSLHSGNLKVSPVPENVAGHPSTDDSTLSCVLPLTCNLGSPALPTLPPRPGPRQSHELSRVQISRICLLLPGGLADPASSPPPAFWRPTWCSP